MSSWMVSERRITVSRGGVSSSVADMPLAHYDGRQTFTPAPDSVCELSVTPSDENCVMLQLCERLGLSPASLRGHFADAASDLYKDADGFPFESTGPWNVEKGITPRMVLHVCMRRRLSCHGFWEDRKIIQHVEPPVGGGSGCVCFSVSSGHFYLLDAEVSRVLSHVACHELP